MKGIKRQLYRALERADQEIEGNAARGGRFAQGTSAEGYAGGYRDALHDVLAALNGRRNTHSRFWPRKDQET